MYERILKLVLKNSKIIKELLNDPDFNINVEGRFLFNEAIRNNDVKMVKILTLFHKR